MLGGKWAELLARGSRAAYNPGSRPRSARGGTMFDLASVQGALRDEGLDGWLLYDFRGLNVLARRVLGIGSEAHMTRRWFYFIPAAGEPRKLVHRIESGALDAYPGGKRVYLRWQELEAGVADLIAGS